MSIDAKSHQPEISPAARATFASSDVDAPELTLLDFDRFFLRELPRLVAMLTALTGQRAVAEELAQEALLRAHIRWAASRAMTPPRSGCDGLG